jgi:ABC-type transporter MlaC component
MQRNTIPAWLMAAALALATTAASASATPFQFIKSCHSKIESLLERPPSPERDAAVTAAVDGMIDYDALIHGCLREHWAELDESKRAEISGLLTQIVRKGYTNKVARTLDYKVQFEGVRTDGARVLVRTHATSARDARAPAVQIDYLVEGPSQDRFHVVDVITENSSLANSYYRDVHRFLTTPSEGYPYLVKKLKQKIARLEAESR